MLRWLGLLSLLLAGCVRDPGELGAPVEEWQPGRRLLQYQVMPGDTIYSVAWAFGQDYHQLARVNHLKEPYRLHSGQLLTWSGQLPGQVVLPRHRVMASPGKLIWPVRVGGSRCQACLPKRYPGLGIRVPVGSTVVAAAGGRVVYVGRGILGYGQLVLLKHSRVGITAYAFNRRVWVKVGQVVHQGQRLAESGRSPQGLPLLYFEWRLHGRPVALRHYALKKSPKNNKR